MRKNSCFIFIFIVLLGSCLLLSFSSPGEAASLVAEQLNLIGQKHFENGDYEEATREFSKALLVESENKTALEYLNRMGIKRGIYGGQLSKESQLSEYIRDYQQHIHELEQQKKESIRLNQLLLEEKKKFQNAVITKEKYNGVLRQKITDIQKEVEFLSAQKQKLLNKAEEMTGGKAEEVARLERILDGLKVRMKGNLVLVEEKENQIEALKHKIETADENIISLESQWKENRVEYEQEIQKLERQISQYKAGLTKSDDRKMQHIRKLEEILRKERLELGITRDKMLFNEYKLMDREKQLKKKNEKINLLKRALSNMEGELTSWKKRMRQIQASGENDRVIEQQNQMIAELKNKLLMAREDIDFLETDVLKGFEERVKKLRDQLGQASVRLRKTEAALREKQKGESEEKDKLIEEQKQTIAKLKEQLNLTKEEVGFLETDVLKGFKAKMETLKKQFEQTKAKLKEREIAYKEKSEDYALLEERLKDTQQRLALVEKIMQEKDGQVADLEDQLDEILIQLEE